MVSKSLSGFEAGSVGDDRLMGHCPESPADRRLKFSSAAS